MSERLVTRVLLGTLRGVLRFVADCRFGLIATLVVGAVFLAIFRWSPDAQDAGNSDGHYEWLYARSLAYDHDVDFKNDYAVCGDPFQKSADRGTGHVDNPYYPGPAVVWTPVLWTFRHTVTLPSDASDRDRAACSGPLMRKTLKVAPLLGALLLWLMYRVGRRFAPDGPAALAATLLTAGSQVAAYASIFTSYSHIHDAFWAAVMLLASVRAAERPRSLARWALAGCCVGIGALQRPVSIVYGVIPAILALASLRGQWRMLVAALVVLGLGAFTFGVVPLSLLYKYLYGAYFLTSPGQYRFFMQYGHAHPWLLLFAPHGGLFYTAPTVWLAVAGAVLGIRDRRTRPLTLALFAAAAAATWISSAALDWHGSGTFGARRITSIVPFCAAPAAMALERVRRWMRARPSRALVSLGIAAALPVAFSITGATLAMAHGRVPTDSGSSQAGFYGEGERGAWQAVDEHFGDVAILPAELLFKLRYGLRMNAFRDATEPLYQRNFLTMGWERNEIDFTNKQHANLVTGFVSSSDGLHLHARRGTIVFAAQWPFATAVTLDVHASRPTHIGIGKELGFGRTEPWDEVNVGTTPTTLTVPIPGGSFDSGIMAIAFELDDPGADLVVRSIRIEDTTAYPSP